VDVRRRMPGRPAGQLVTLKKHDITPAKLCQMIQNGTADKTTPDNNSLRVLSHIPSNPLNLPSVIKVAAEHVMQIAQVRRLLQGLRRQHHLICGRSEAG
jgi:hypothetical protein